MNIIGISAFYHDSACCLLIDGQLKCAVQEERFSRIKNDNALPKQAFQYCLESEGLSITDIDYIAYYEDPLQKLERQLWSGIDIQQPENAVRMSPLRPENEIRKNLGYEGEIKFVGHHLSHAASSYYFSGFSEAAIMVVDAVGEWDTTTFFSGKDNLIKRLDEKKFPHSIGLLYAAITAFLGFRINSGEYKVMGLAPYGKPVYSEQMDKLVKFNDSGFFELNLTYFDFIKNQNMFSKEMVALFGMPPRIPESEICQEHMDLACSLQVLLEKIILSQAIYLKKLTNARHLCFAGGVALNCVANSVIEKSGLFDEIFIQPASGDAGTCLGAAAYVYYEVLGNKYVPKQLESVFLGPSYHSQQVRKILDATHLSYHDYTGKTDEMLHDVAYNIDRGMVVGWFQGRMEFGPRALGNRSIIADPRNPNMRDKINAMVKKRESFRPFAPSILDSKKTEYFYLEKKSPFMLFTYFVRSPKLLPAITHVNGSARIQTVQDKSNRFSELIKAFYDLTGCPILLNTSFNMRGEPIVMNVEDAIICFVNSHLDSLVIEDYVLYKNENNLLLLRLLLQKMQQNRFSQTRNLYTFL